MSLWFRCTNPKCGKSLGVAGKHAGKRTKCPACGEVLTIPAAPPGKADGSAPSTRDQRGEDLRLAEDVDSPTGRDISPVAEWPGESPGKRFLRRAISFFRLGRRTSGSNSIAQDGYFAPPRPRRESLSLWRAVQGGFLVIVGLLLVAYSGLSIIMGKEPLDPSQPGFLAKFAMGAVALGSGLAILLRKK